MDGTAILIKNWAGRGAFKAAALIAAFIIIVAVWWKLGANKKYTGPVRTIDTDDLGHVIEPPPDVPPSPAVAGGSE